MDPSTTLSPRTFPIVKASRRRRLQLAHQGPPSSVDPSMHRAHPLCQGGVGSWRCTAEEGPVQAPRGNPSRGESSTVLRQTRPRCEPRDCRVLVGRVARWPLLQPRGSWFSMAVMEDSPDLHRTGHCRVNRPWPGATAHLVGQTAVNTAVPRLGPCFSQHSPCTGFRRHPAPWSSTELLHSHVYTPCSSDPPLIGETPNTRTH